jgi:hypothetical protein
LPPPVFALRALRSLVLRLGIYGIICGVKENNMSRLSFKSFCIEFYARHIGSTGADVYKMFSESGLLKTLDDDYEDLHGLGWEALMPMFDEYLGRSAK